VGCPNFVSADEPAFPDAFIRRTQSERVGGDEPTTRQCLVTIAYLSLFPSRDRWNRPLTSGTPAPSRNAPRGWDNQLGTFVSSLTSSRKGLVAGLASANGAPPTLSQSAAHNKFVFQPQHQQLSATCLLNQRQKSQSLASLTGCGRRRNFSRCLDLTNEAKVTRVTKSRIS
jgi:hypothetical protein